LWHGSEVAVKKFKVKLDGVIMENMLKEAELLAQLKHTHIVEFLGNCQLCCLTPIRDFSGY
jgi:hypothetical protein